MAATTKDGYRWATLGDLDAFFGLMLDNVTILVLFSSILSGVFGFPLEFIFTKMLPGTALAVLIGDLAYTAMAFKIAKRTKNPNFTAMPLGLDAPSTIGMAFIILGPAYIATGHNAELTWYIGMSSMFFIGILKIIFSFFAQSIQKAIPQSGLLGSLAGIGIALLCFMQLVEIFKMPVVGLISMGIIFFTVMAKIKLPKRLPGIFIAVFVGTVVYYITGHYGLLGLSEFKVPELVLRFAFPLPNFSFIQGFKDAIPYLPIALPFGFLTIIGGINVTESARLTGDEFKTRDVILVDGLATIIGSICGGVAQSTPYIGQPAYKAMGARAAYTLATGLFIGLGGMLGYISFVVDFIPAPAVAGIIVFVGLEILSQAFHVCPVRHYTAIGLAFMPTFADLILIQLDNYRGQMMGALYNTPGIPEILAKTPLVLPHEIINSITVITALAHGFIITGMLWGAILTFMIDREFYKASLTLVITGALTFFGIIHSVLPTGGLYLPWKIDASVPGNTYPYYLTAAYLSFALVLFILKNITSEEQLNTLLNDDQEPVPKEQVLGVQA